MLATKILSRHARNIIGSQVSLARFTKTGNDYCAEISDFIGVQLLGQLYNDAADQGFVLVNPKTGNGVPMVLREEIMYGRGEDQELSGWKFVPAKSDLPGEFGHLDFTVTLFND